MGLHVIPSDSDSLCCKRHYQEALLEWFLNHSDEDQVDGEIIGEKIHSLFQDRKNIRWLDIGFGPARKIIRVAEYQETSGGPMIIFDGIDISSYWCTNLQRFHPKSNNLRIRQIICDAWNENGGSSPLGEKYDVISFMHSIYWMRTDSNGIPALRRAAQLVNEKGLLIIIVESPQSDIFALKERFLSKDIESSPSSYIMVESTLENMGLSWKRVISGPQSFRVVENDGMPFIGSPAFGFIQSIIEEYINKSLSNDECVFLEDTIRLLVKASAGGFSLSMPDYLYFAAKSITNDRIFDPGFIKANQGRDMV